MKNFVRKTKLEQKHEHFKQITIPSTQGTIVRPVFLNELLTQNYTTGSPVKLTNRAMTPPILTTIPSSTRNEEKVVQNKTPRKKRDSRMRPARSLKTMKTQPEQQPTEPAEQLPKNMIRRRSCCCTWCGGASVFETKHKDIVNDFERFGRHSFIQSPGLKKSDSPTAAEGKGGSRASLIFEEKGRKNTGSFQDVKRKLTKMNSVVKIQIQEDKGKGASMNLEQVQENTEKVVENNPKPNNPINKRLLESDIISKYSENEEFPSHKKRVESAKSLNMKLGGRSKDKIVSFKPVGKSRLPSIGLNNSSSQQQTIFSRSEFATPQIGAQKGAAHKKANSFQLKETKGLKKSDSMQPLDSHKNQTTLVTIFSPVERTNGDRMNMNFGSEHASSSSKIKDLMPSKINLVGFSFCEQSDELILEDPSHQNLLRKSSGSSSALFNHLTNKIKENKEKKERQRSVKKQQQHEPRTPQKSKERYINIYSDEKMLKTFQSISNKNKLLLSKSQSSFKVKGRNGVSNITFKAFQKGLLQNDNSGEKDGDIDGRKSKQGVRPKVQGEEKLGSYKVKFLGKRLVGLNKSQEISVPKQ